MTTSLRIVAEHMDPVRPSYRLGGSTDELGEYWLREGGGGWIRNARVREQLRDQPNLHTLGLAHKRRQGHRAAASRIIETLTAGDRASSRARHGAPLCLLQHLPHTRARASLGPRSHEATA